MHAKACSPILPRLFFRIAVLPEIAALYSKLDNEPRWPNPFAISTAISPKAYFRLQKREKSFSPSGTPGMSS
jgi:hypothetical protein